MKTKENITVYICDHCKKRYFKKHACENHEPVCYSNPENKSACSDCQFLKQGTTEVYYDMFDGEHSRQCKSFTCEKLNKGVYPFKVVRMGIIDKHPETFEDQIQMPKECEHYKHEADYFN